MKDRMNEEDKNNIEVFVCSVCKEKFESKTTIIKHMLYAHQNEPSVKKIQRKMHKKTVKSSIQNINNIGETTKIDNITNKIGKVRKYSSEYKCDKCAYRTGHLTTYNRHLQTHEKGSRVYKCEHCSYAAIQPYNLKRHLKDVHPFGGVEPVYILRTGGEKLN